MEQFHPLYLEAFWTKNTCSESNDQWDEHHMMSLILISVWSWWSQSECYIENFAFDGKNVTENWKTYHWKFWFVNEKSDQDKYRCNKINFKMFAVVCIVQVHHVHDVALVHACSMESVTITRIAHFNRSVLQRAVLTFII